MVRFKFRGTLVSAVFVVAAFLILAACGGGDPTQTLVQSTSTVTTPPAVSATETPVPVPTAAPTTVPPQPTATQTTATAAVTPTLTSEPRPTAAPTVAAAPTHTTAPTPTTPPIATPTPVATATTATPPTPTPVLLDTLDEFGFVLKLDTAADVKSSGWTAAEPDARQGTLNLTLGEVAAILIWGPRLDRAPVTFLADTYNILRSSQSEFTFDSVSEGSITVSGEDGVYGGFRTLNSGGTVIGGGIIGAWICSTTQTAYRLTLTGANATLAQVRFDRLLDNFACSK